MANTKNYTDKERKDLLKQYIQVPQRLFDKIPVGSHIRFLKKGDEPIGERFKPGGYVKNHWTNKDGVPHIQIQNRKYSVGSKGYFEFPLVPDNIEKIWKKVPDEFFIEYLSLVQLIHNIKK